MKRVLFADEPAEAPPVDQYDLMVVDECHRGYLLDREMSDAELSFRSQDDYISKYRRVLEYFDAVKIGLTATPALHTVRHLRRSDLHLLLPGGRHRRLPDRPRAAGPDRDRARQAGIKFAKDEQVELLDTRTGEIDLAHAPDEIRFEVDEFNKKVVTVPFNRVVAEELAKPHRPEPSRQDADLRRERRPCRHRGRRAQEGFRATPTARSRTPRSRRSPAAWTGSASLIRSFRNDALPKIAVTVDLLTTGIDVPSITNLVFLRRVNSRILYEQMIGRATRQCPEIGKEMFRIFDAVDLYPHLQNLTEMKPVVVNPSISLEQLFEELAAARGRGRTVRPSASRFS